MAKSRIGGSNSPIPQLTTAPHERCSPCCSRPKSQAAWRLKTLLPYARCWSRRMSARSLPESGPRPDTSCEITLDVRSGVPEPAEGPELDRVSQLRQNLTNIARAVAALPVARAPSPSILAQLAT